MEAVSAALRLAFDVWSQALTFLWFSIQRAFHANARSIQHVGIDLRRAHVLVAKKLLDGADVAAAFEQVRGEGMTKRVRRNFLVQLRTPRRFPDICLQAFVQHVMTAAQTARKLMEFASKKINQRLHPEDVSICRYHRSKFKDFNFAPVDVANRFSTRTITETAFGYHKQKKKPRLINTRT